MSHPKISITPHFPTYEQVNLLLPVFNGLRDSDIRELINTIAEQTGTPQNPADWSDPEKWIPERLNVKESRISQKNLGGKSFQS